MIQSDIWSGDIWYLYHELDYLVITDDNKKIKVAFLNGRQSFSCPIHVVSSSTLTSILTMSCRSCTAGCYETNLRRRILQRLYPIKRPLPSSNVASYSLRPNLFRKRYLDKKCAAKICSFWVRTICAGDKSYEYLVDIVVQYHFDPLCSESLIEDLAEFVRTLPSKSKQHIWEHSVTKRTRDGRKVCRMTESKRQISRLLCDWVIVYVNVWALSLSVSLSN